MSKTVLHQVLAVEPSLKQAVSKLFAETMAKFEKTGNFDGSTRILKMIEDSEANKALMEAEAQHTKVPYTVANTLAYLLDVWSSRENAKFTKSLTNQVAKADILLHGKVLIANVPVDMLLNLEVELNALRTLFLKIPTLSATAVMNPTAGDGNRQWIGEPVVTIKTAKITEYITVAPATDKFPAQVKDVTKDVPIGSYTTTLLSGKASTHQKARLLSRTDELIRAVIDARMRANLQPIVEGEDIGTIFSDLFMSCFEEA